MLFIMSIVKFRIKARNVLLKDSRSSFMDVVTYNICNKLGEIVMYKV